MAGVCEYGKEILGTVHGGIWVQYTEGFGYSTRRGLGTVHGGV